ncbi:MAG: hypothetical protein PHP32_06035 [Candidatus Izemoplasmatales bacterium]|jgi:ribosome maturation factor RimP|nr:hypothetical protein [Candidatus Izemoplasmatales bacterium]
MNLIDDIEKLLKPPLEHIGASIYEITLKLEQGTHVLHVALMREDGPVDLDYIVKATELISPILDGSKLIDHRYMLDVSSAGIEKPIPIEHLRDYIGTYIAVHLRKPFRGENKLEAALVGISNDNISLEGFIKGRKYTTEISIADIDKVREAIKF